MFALSKSMCFRKSEVGIPNGENFDGRHFRRSSLLWEIDGALYADPSPELLRTVVAGRDKAVIKPPTQIRTRMAPPEARTPLGSSTTPKT